MLRVVEGVPEIPRGDYGEMEVQITDEQGNEYKMQEGDYLTFSVRELPTKDSKLLIQIHSITNTIVFNPADTADVEPGQYSADVEMNTADGKRFTIWCYIPEEKRDKGKVKNWKNFIVLPEVT